MVVKKDSGAEFQAPDGRIKLQIEKQALCTLVWQMVTLSTALCQGFYFLSGAATVQIMKMENKEKE